MYSKEKDFITYIVKGMVSYPDDVSVTLAIDDIGPRLTVVVNKLDMARVIGKKGQTANALKQILRVVSFTNNSRVTMQIVDSSQI
jgi:hypothetical protein